ncbi:MAG: response regulator [Candidatus Omnitrophota bacterium]
MNRLLIVDDEEDVRDFAANFFRKRKIDVVTAENGEEALKILDKEKLELILLDINMAGLSGIEVLRQIRNKNIGVKVIMVTGTKPEEGSAFDQCTELGALDYIHKPLQLEELERVVMSLLKISQEKEK